MDSCYLNDKPVSCLILWIKLIRAGIVLNRYLGDRNFKYEGDEFDCMSIGDAQSKEFRMHTNG